MQKYLKASTEERLRAHITPKQAVPLFLSKLLLLARYISRKIAERSVNPCGLFVLARDQVFFKALFFSGDRGSDLGMVRTERSCASPRTVDCCLIMFGEKPHKMALPKYSEFGDILTLNQLCLVKAIVTYVVVASELRVSVTNGYLFRPTNHQGHIVNKPFTISSAEARLKLYLKEAQIDEGETLHSFRSGSAIT